MTSTHNDPESSKSADAHNAIDWLILESKRHKNSKDFVAFLVSHISASSHPARDLEYAIGALRTAFGEHLKDRTSEVAGNRCHFCGKSQAEVRTLMVSAESAICDECIPIALETIIHKRGDLHLRVAFFIFDVVASVGYYISRLFRGTAR